MRFWKDRIWFLSLLGLIKFNSFKRQTYYVLIRFDNIYLYSNPQI